MFFFYVGYLPNELSILYVKVCIYLTFLFLEKVVLFYDLGFGVAFGFCILGFVYFFQIPHSQVCS